MKNKVGIVMRTLKTLAIAATFVTPVAAAPVAVPNFSFETPTAPVQSTSIDGWSFAGNGGTDPSSFGFPGGDPDGTQHLFLQLPAFGGVTPNAATSNAGGIGSAAAGDYVLTVALGRRDNGATTNGAYRIELLSAGAVIAFEEVTNPLETYAPGSWNDVSATTTLALGDAAIGGDLAIRLIAVAGTNATQGQFDNVRLDFVAAAVPAPAMLTLFSLAVAGLGARHKRRRTS